MPGSPRCEIRPCPTVTVPPPPPALPSALYRQRLAAVRTRMAETGVELLAVYGDREHSANLAYLTGFDPRFEEALLLLAADGRAKLLVGNECLGYTPDPALGIEIELFQEFSLLGQPREQSRPLRAILHEFGARPGTRVGVVGWKYFDGALLPATAVDVPAYLAAALGELCGDSLVSNATALLMDAHQGMRAVNEPAQLLHFEYAANVTAAGVLALLPHLADDLTEWELERYLEARGLPLSCHRMISAGEKVRRGLSSPSTRVVQHGDPYVVAFGVAGGLTCRAGYVARGPQELPAEAREFYPALAANYFAVVSTWYETVRVGVTGEEVFRAVDAVRDPGLFTFAVNPGHLLHLDEWLHSPFAPGNRVPLASGMALQLDIIPQSQGVFCYINAEDGVALADAALCAELQRSHPEFWQRTQHRRATMQQAYGITLHESVLPLSDLAGWLPPYALDLTHVMVNA
jgi:Xaa-Pro aminopeptidase